MPLSDLFRRWRKRWRKGRLNRRRLWLIALGIAGAYGLYVVYDLPNVSKLGEIKKAASITVKAEDGTVLGTYGDIYGDYVPYAQLPKDLIRAVIATEDRNFFYHFGIDPLGLLRASYANLRARRVVQGGSTITQQLAKNAFLTPARTLKRKLQEMILAFELEARFSKKEILTIYLNRVYMGAGNYGVDAASRRYFGHSVRQISLGEAAILVGLLKAPSRYAPTSNPDLSEKRATQVLLNMVEAGYLTPQKAQAARADFHDEDATYRDSHGFGSFYFSDYVIGLLPAYIGDTTADLVITTTLKPEWQNLAEDAVTGVLAKRGGPLRASQAALFAMSPDGAIRAMVGGKNYRASQFNRVTQGLRQPGSSFKLFVYLAGLEAGYLPSSEMEDMPINVGSWHPRDYTGQYKGRMTLRDAFAQSTNSIAVQLSEAVGRGRVIEMAQRLGITSDLEADPSIALGTGEATLFDMTKAYAHLAANGQSVYPYAITRIETPDGHILYERKSTGGGQVLKPEIVGMMNDMLLAVTTVGTGRAAQIGRPVAGKTGTTSDYRDAWFLGFVPQLVAGVWVGNDDTSPMKKVTGGTLPASIFHEFMQAALKNVPVAGIPSQSGPSGEGFLPWLFQSGPEQQGEPGSLSPKEQQNQMPGGPAPYGPYAPGPGLSGGPSEEPNVAPGHRPDEEQNAVPGHRPDEEPIPEEAPTPEYNAPQQRGE